MKRKELADKLENIRKSLEDELPNFPSFCCGSASKRVAQLLNLKKVYGWVQDPNTGEHISAHCWNYDPDSQRYADITLNQFKELRHLGSIVILPENSKLAKKIYKVIGGYV